MSNVMLSLGDEQVLDDPSRRVKLGQYVRIVT